MWLDVQKWSGVVLGATVTVATIWLAITNQLILYIHPRYVVFTVIMAALALIVAVASVAVRPRDEHDEAPRGWRKALAVIALGLTVLIAAAVIVIPPSTWVALAVSRL